MCNDCILGPQCRAQTGGLFGESVGDVFVEASLSEPVWAWLRVLCPWQWTTVSSAGLSHRHGGETEQGAAVQNISTRNSRCCFSLCRFQWTNAERTGSKFSPLCQKRKLGLCRLSTWWKRTFKGVKLIMVGHTGGSWLKLMYKKRRSRGSIKQI